MFTRKRRPSIRSSALLLSAVVLVVSTCWLAGAGCSRSRDAGRIRIALNWKPEPEFGGLYEALESGAFERRGLDVEVTGGPGAPVIQMVAAGKVPFGIVSADEVLLARANGARVKAVFATYQTCPQGIMVHASRGLSSLAQVFESGTLAIEPGVPFGEFLRRKYGFDRIKVVPYSFSIAPFLADPDMAQQCFVTSEPIEARRRGADPKVFLIADSGYDPYTAVVVCRDRLLEEEPERVAAFLDGLREGWHDYLVDPDRANAVMGKLNTEMDAETFRLGAAAQKSLIEIDDGVTVPVGSMRAERWTELAHQFVDLGLLEVALEPSAYFVDVAARAGSTPPE